MKSLLVDALRQANDEESDQVLSDSGSFDARSEDFAETANDEHGEDTGELELMSTTKALVVTEEVTDDTPDASIEDEDLPRADAAAAFNHEEEVDFSVTIVGEMPTPVDPQKMPRIAQFSPLLCLALAATVAGGWLLYQQLGAPLAGGNLGTVLAQSRAAHTPGVPKSGISTATPSRFPFLESGSSTAKQEVVQ